MITAEQIANSLPKCRRLKPDEYKACCPAHDDNSPSLSISQKSDSVLVYCWSGCSQSEVLGRRIASDITERLCGLLPGGSAVRVKTLPFDFDIGLDGVGSLDQLQARIIAFNQYAFFSRFSPQHFKLLTHYH